MASLQPITQSFYLQPPVAFEQRQYRKGSIMAYLYDTNALWAHVAQIAKLDELLDCPTFGGTVFMPSKEYSRLYYPYLQQHLDRETARNMLSASILSEVVPKCVLAQQEYVPTLNKYHDIHVTRDNPEIIVDGDKTIIIGDLVFDNGVVHVINGLIAPIVKI